jgi:small-conductance mechanosensitive channel
VCIGWALGVLGAKVRWLTILVIAILVLGTMVAKPVLDGLVANVMVATRTAFTVGDQIEVDGIVGEVERVTNRSTVLRTSDGRRVHIPNSELIDKTVTAYTAYEERRSSIDLTVALESDLDVDDVIVRETLATVHSIERVGSIRANSFNEGIDLSIDIWHGPRVPEGNAAVDAAVRQLKVAFEQAGIRLASATSIRIDEAPQWGRWPRSTEFAVHWTTIRRPRRRGEHRRGSTGRAATSVLAQSGASDVGLTDPASSVHSRSASQDLSISGKRVHTVPGWH